MISSRPRLYGDYVQKLTETLAARRGTKLSVDQVSAIRARLQAAATAPVEVRAKRVQSAITALAESGGDAVSSELQAAMDYETTENEITATLKARAQNEAKVVGENSSGMGNILLAPELADGSYSDAQGQEYENAENFLNNSNPIPRSSPNYKAAKPGQVNGLLDKLDSSATELLETQRRCKSPDCK